MDAGDRGMSDASLERDTFEPAGERQRFRIDADGSTIVHFDDKGTGRVCGACQLCCKLLPVPQLGKGASQKCRHSKAGKGCQIYPARPDACRWFACGWLADEDAGELQRPDRTHYVIDLAPDQIDLDLGERGRHRIGALQIWCDPAYPHAHRDPSLRSYLTRLSDRIEFLVIVRYNERDSIVLMPPRMTGRDDWYEKSDDLRVVQRLT